MTVCGPNHEAPPDGSCACGAVSRHPVAVDGLLVERVAIAIAQTGYESIIDDDRWQYAFREDERDDFRTYTAAAIDAMRATS